MAAADPEAPRPALLVDHMLVKLGCYLRALGYDASYQPGRRTHELIERANFEGRVFLTRNRHLQHAYPRPRTALVLHADDPVRQLRHVVAALDLDPRRWLFTRCIRCNVALEAVADPVEVQSEVAPRVYAAYRRFWRCPGCRTVFWLGSHVRNTCAKLGLEAPEEWGS
jgi:uncharacterized protein with PIN domain